MDGDRFDRWTRGLDASFSRRGLGGIIASALATLGLGGAAEAGKKKGKKKKKKKNKNKNKQQPSPPAPAGCPNGCAFNEFCSNGVCVPACIGGQQPCPGAPGGCCPLGTVCSGNACVTTCADGRPRCGGECCGVDEVCDETDQCRVPCTGNACLTYELEETWSGTGQANGAFDSPCGVALDDDGNVYVLDCDRDRVVKFDTEGTFLDEWPAAGWGLAVDGNEFVYVANGSLVSKFTTSGDFVEHLTRSGMFAAVDASVDAAGFVYVITETSPAVFVFDPDGSSFDSWTAQPPATAFSFPLGITLGVTSEVFVANRGAHLIQAFSRDGTFLREWGGLGACGDAGGDSCSDPRFNSKFRNPAGVAVDSEGNLFVADFGNHRVVVYDAAGDYLGQFGAGELGGPDSLAVDGEGNVFVADSVRNEVAKYVRVDGVMRSARRSGADRLRAASTRKRRRGRHRD